MRIAAGPLAVAGIVLLSAAARFALGREIVTPFILIDELLHGKLAESVAEGDWFRVRGEHMTVTYLYPLLLAPAWLADSMETTYGVAKAINAFVMSLAAVPVYLWGRRLVAERWAIAAAALTVAMPSLVFTGTLMAENAFLPVFLLAAWAIAHALETPTLARQALAVGAIGLAAATRVQGLLLVAVLVTAVLVHAREVWRWWPSGVVVAAAGVALLVLPRGLGVYGGVDDPDYSVGGLAKWLVYHAGELALAVGLVPLAALLVLRPRNSGERAFLAVAGSATAWLLVLAAVSAEWNPVGIKERYLLHCMPLLFLALALWLERGMRRSWVVAAGLVALVAALPLGELFRQPSLLGNAFGLLPFYRLSLETGGVRLLAIALALAAAAIFLFARRPLLVPLAVGAYLLVANAPTFAVLRNQALGVRDLTAPSQWIDPRVDGEVAYLNTSNYAPETLKGDLWSQWAPVWEAQFWNRRLDRVISLEYPEPAPLAQVDAKLDWATGTIRGVTAEHVLADRRFRPHGSLLDSRSGLDLWTVEGPLRFASVREGIYSNGTMGTLAAYTQWTTALATPVFVEVVLRGERLGRAVVSGGQLAVVNGVGALPEGVQSIEGNLNGELSLGIQTSTPPFRVEVRVERPGASVEFRMRAL